MPLDESDRVTTSGTGASGTSRPRWGYLAAAWALLFSGLHVYWALGGALGLGSSAGMELARDPPLWFLLFGLWGVALVLLVGAALGLVLARARLSGLPGRLAAILGCLVGALLLIRGIGVELLLMTDALGVASNVGQDQVHASLVLWNPWFVVGGLVFALAGFQGRRDRSSLPLPRSHSGRSQ